MAAKPPTRRGKVGVIARHHERAKIEFDLARGVPVRVVAKKYSLTPSCCYRHLQKMPAGFRAEKFAELLKPGANIEELRISESEGLLVGLHNDRVRLEMLRDAYEERADGEMVVRVQGLILKHRELTGKLLGELGSLVSNSTVNNILVLQSPEYAALEAGLLHLVRKHPEIRADVIALVRGLKPQATPPDPRQIEGERVAA